MLQVFVLLLLQQLQVATFITVHHHVPFAVGDMLHNSVHAVHADQTAVSVPHQQHALFAPAQAINYHQEFAHLNQPTAAQPKLYSLD